MESMGSHGFIGTGSRALDDALGGGLARGALTQVFGEKGVGKSLLSLQTACYTVSRGRSAVIFDTEQSYGHLLGWLPAFERRFKGKLEVRQVRVDRILRRDRRGKAELKGMLEALLSQLKLNVDGQKLQALLWLLCPDVSLNYEKAKGPAIYIVSSPYIQDILHLHGVRADISSSSGGRVEVRMLPGMVIDAIVSPVGNLIKEVGADLLIYDSLSAPFKSTFISTQDLPARSATLAILLSQAQRMCNSLSIAVLAINHVSENPSNPYDIPRPFGGRIVGYDFKFSYELVNLSKSPKATEQKRALIVHRHLLIPPYSKKTELKIAEEGFL